MQRMRRWNRRRRRRRKQRRFKRALQVCQRLEHTPRAWSHSAWSLHLSLPSCSSSQHGTVGSRSSNALRCTIKSLLRARYRVGQRLKRTRIGLCLLAACVSILCLALCYHLLSTAQRPSAQEPSRLRFTLPCFARMQRTSFSSIVGAPRSHSCRLVLVCLVQQLVDLEDRLSATWVEWTVKQRNMGALL